LHQASAIGILQYNQNWSFHVGSFPQRNNRNMFYPHISGVRSRGGIRTLNPIGRQILLTTETFVSLSVCGLDYPFSIVFLL